MRVLKVWGVALIVLAGVTAVGASSSGAAASNLTRYPYLTDLVGTAVTINWATDRSATTGSAVWGAVDGTGACSPTNSVAGTKTGITVNNVAEYQWKAQLTLPSSGRYCYRVFLGTTDLLAADPSPAFTTQVPAGSTEPFSFAVFGDWGQGLSGGNPDEANVLGQIAIERGPVRAHGRGQRLHGREPDELRRSPADGCEHQRRVRAQLLGGTGPLDPAVRERRQSRFHHQRDQSQHRPPELPAGPRRRRARMART